jgi:hypothetical protein
MNMRRGLAALSELGALAELNLSDTGVTDAGMPSLARLRRLQSLNLSYTGAPLCQGWLVCRRLSALHRMREV